MRLNKFISESGLCSRREADELIDAGRVQVNGEVATTGAKTFDGDTVTVDGEIVRVLSRGNSGRRHVYIALNKPVGITCTTDTTVKGNIVDHVAHAERVFPVGRLDKESPFRRAGSQPDMIGGIHRF